MYMVMIGSFKLLKIKTLLLCHNVFEHEENYLKRAISKLVLKIPDYYLVHTESEKRKLLPIIRGKKNIQHLHPLYHFSASPLKQCSTKETKSELNLLFFGFVRDYKGLDILLEALKLLSSNKINLKIVGEFWTTKSDYQAYIDAESISGITIVDRYISDKEIAFYFNEADVVVLPYRSATGSGVIATSYGYGKPVLVTNVGGLPEAVDNKRTGFIVEPTASGLAQGILWFSANGEIDFSTNIAAYTNDFMSWKSLSSKILELI